MSLLLSVPDDIANAVHELSHRCNATPEELLVRALRAHFSPLSADLAQEFEAWEQATDVDTADFERSYLTIT